MNPNFERVDAQIAATPHADMDMGDVGSTTAAGSSDMSTSQRDQAGWNSEQFQQGEVPPVEPPVDTIDLLENIE